MWPATTMESQSQESTQRAAIGGAEISLVPEDAGRPVLPADLLNLNDAEMAKLFEPGQQSAVFFESYSFQDMQDIVSSNPDLINESFESLIKDLDELSQPESPPPEVSEEKKLDPSIPFLNCTKQGSKFMNLKEDPIHTQSMVGISSQNILSVEAHSFQNQNFVSNEVPEYPITPGNDAATSMLKCNSNEAAFSSLTNNDQQFTDVNRNTVLTEKIEKGVDSTAPSQATCTVMPVCCDQTVPSLWPLHDIKSEEEKDNLISISCSSMTCLENCLVSQSLPSLSSSSKSPTSKVLMKCPTLLIQDQKTDSTSRTLSCDSANLQEYANEIEEQVLQAMERIIGKVEANIECIPFVSISCKVKTEALSDSSETPHGVFKCQKCSQVFNMKTNFSHHQSSHSKIQVFCCDPCDLVLETEAEILEHNIKVHKNYNGYSCEVCSTTMPTYCEFLEHFGYHSKQQPFQCGECDLQFREFSSYCIHLSQHTGELIFKCIVCTALFRSKDDLYCHQRFFHSPNIMTEEKTVVQKNDVFKCETCGKLFNKLRAMIMHKTVTHKSHNTRLKEKSKLCCATCGKKFASVKKLRGHTAAAHHSNRPMKKTNKKSTFKCSECWKSFHSNAVYSRHVLTHQPKSRRSSLKAKFQIKVSSSSFRELKFLCEFCCDPFRRASDLKKHIESMHTPVKDTAGTRGRQKAKKFVSSPSGASHSAFTPIKVSRGPELKDDILADQDFQVIQANNEVWVNISNNILRGTKAEGSDPEQLEKACKFIRQRCSTNSSNDDESILHFCTQCSLSFKTIFELIQHKQLHPLPFLCPTCGLSYLIENDLINHICLF
ncbi:Zinc finger protein 528 [Frankliniella fusca]|uniref:Zinc finger protein 528 n=1 Tax=Frankliniella fusca TaxID=407009 RepID=A0AAE1H278_9NEOP|nr:Zinc finger protein 528 [Frankliniella fusca]